MTRPHRFIESESNPVFKQLRLALSGRGMRKHNAALVAGEKNVAEVVARRPELCTAWVGTARHPGPPAAFPQDGAWYQLAPALFQSLDVSGTRAPMVLVETPEWPQWRAADELPEGCSLLVPFQDPENVGAVVRSAVAFGVTRIVLLAECAHPFHPKAVRASGGAVLSADLWRGPSLSEVGAGLPVVALSPRGRDVGTFEFPERFALLPGLEGPGLPERLRENAVSIPLSPGVESLNAAAATAVVLYLWRRSVRT